MSAQYTPVVEIKPAAKAALHYLRDNRDVFWRVLKPYLPYIVGAHLIGLALLAAGIIVLPEGIKGNPVGEMVGGYFVLCFTLTWYRVIILGPQRADGVNPFRLKRHEIRCLLFGIGIIFMFFIAGFPAGFLAARSLVAAITLGVILLAVTAWIALRLSFYPASTAVDAGITLRESFKLSRGRVLRMFAANALALTIMALIAFAAAVVLAIGAGIITYFLPAPVALFIQGVVMLPVPVILGPAVAAVAATVLSNYYLLAVRG